MATKIKNETPRRKRTGYLSRVFSVFRAASGGVLNPSFAITEKDERPTSNIERPTSNNDVAPLRQFINWQNSLFDVRC